MSSRADTGPSDHPIPRSRTRDDGPLWAGILADLRARLERGEFDDRFPTDRELMNHYGVSRHTVREAVRGLGRVERRPRVGGRIRPVVGTVQQLSTALAALGIRLDLLELDPPQAPDGPRHSHLLMADGQPLLVSRLWPTPDTTVTEDEVLGLLGLGIDAGLALVGERLLPTVPDPDVHTALMLPTPTAVYAIDADIERSGRHAGRHTAYVRADRYRCAIRFDAQIP